MNVQKRVEKLTKIRKMDFIPGVLYGQESGPANIQVEKTELMRALIQHGQTAVFPLEFDGITHKVYVRDLQREVIRREKFQHFSLQIVSGTDKIRALVPIRLENKGIVEGKGLVVNQVLHEIEVKYGVSDHLEDIVVDIVDFGAGDSRHLSDLTLPSYLEVLTPLDVQVFSVMAPKGPTVDDIAADEAVAADVAEAAPTPQA